MSAGDSGQPVPEPQVASPRRRLARLPTLLWLVIVALSLVTAWMIAVTIDRPAPDEWGFRNAAATLGLGFGSVGALVAARRPGNRMGWMLLGISVVAALQGIVDEYPILADRSSPALPLADESRWVAAWIWPIPAGLYMTLMPLTFPDGRLLSRRWRAAVVFGLAAVAVLSGAIALASQPFGPVRPTTNPGSYFAAFGPIMAVGYVLLVGAICVALSSVAVRYRAARGDARQQMKWFVFAGSFLIITAPAGFSGHPIGALLLAANGAFACAAVVVAILRYRLYEIDVIINRTVVYGFLTAILAGVYTASISLTQRLFSAVTGDRSDAAIVLTTLIVVSLFTPIKTRLQAIVDARVKTAPSHGTGATLAGLAHSASVEAAEVLATLDQLRVSGGLTQGEFDAKKAELLSRI
jgi:hypothetical protein